ncbi:Gamma-tubulin complex component 3-like protein [Smittium mucronatum]|uniref:Gamma-tubulin complex component 3-like protein n=1 Tax=Smittium mucronatum TaxID=133383 RepID=A0A1R0H856_9FUNG|nr:Gamma-tubulin complex component 3-like protein [Smittium mucronatum]
MSSPLDDELNYLVNSFLGPPNPNFPLQEEYRRNNLASLCKNILSSNFGKNSKSEQKVIELIQKQWILQVFCDLSKDSVKIRRPKGLANPIFDKNFFGEPRVFPNHPIPESSLNGYNPEPFTPSNSHQSPVPKIRNSQNDQASILLTQLAPRIDSVSEDVLIRDILFVTQGVDGRYIVWESNNQSYSIDPSISLSNPTMFLLDRLLELGELNHRITNYIDSPQSSQSLVRQGFRLALSYELEELSEFVSDLESRHAEALASPDTTRIENRLFLRKLYLEFQGQIQKLRILASIIDSLYINTPDQEISTSLGGEMLSKIHIFTRDGAPNVKEISNKMLKASASSFNNILLRWITEGKLEDPFKEFFVELNDDSDSRSLWVKQYSIDVSKIPVYINSDLVRKIFLIGKSLGFLRTACGDEEWISQQRVDKFMSNSNSTKSTNGPSIFFDISDPEALNSHVDSVYQVVNSRLMKVMIEKYNLMNHVAAMKKYLLLEQGDFVQFLVETLGNQLDKPSNRLLHHNIMTAVESAVRNSNAQYDSVEYTDRISVRLNAIPHGENSGWSAFPITYHIDSPITYVISESTMLKYNELTTFLLRSLIKKNKSLNSSDVLGMNEKDVQFLLKRMRICCGEMMHFIHQLERYIYLNAIEGAYNKFLSSIYEKKAEYSDFTCLLLSSEDFENGDDNARDDNREGMNLGKNVFKKLKKDLDLDQWIVAHDNYISEVRRLVMGKKRNYINIVEHILNTINLFCISSDYMFNDMAGVGNSRILLKKSANISAKEKLGNFADMLDAKSGASPKDKPAEEEESPVIEQVENTMKTFRHDIRNMLKLFADGSDSTFLKGLAVSFDLNQFYTVGLGKNE